MVMPAMFRRTRPESVPSARPGWGGKRRRREEDEGKEVGGEHIGWGIRVEVANERLE